MAVPIHARATAELDPITLYRLLRLRVDVFVVEQDCPYPELDGRDLEPGTLQLWFAEGEQVLATLRLLRESEGRYRIGRVATAAGARSRGLAGQLMAVALERAAGAEVVLDAQSYLTGWYARFGFEPAGAEFVEDGIPHVPMHRAATGSP